MGFICLHTRIKLRATDFISAAILLDCRSYTICITSSKWSISEKGESLLPYLLISTTDVVKLHNKKLIISFKYGI